MFPVSDEFSDRRGRWGFYSPWDATEHKQSAIGFLATQEHVDLRSFRTFSDTTPVPQDPDLDTVTQDPYLDLVPQTELETKQGAFFSEKWKTVSGGTGLNQVIKGYWDVTVTYSTNDIVEYKGLFYKTSGSSLGQVPTQGSPWSLQTVVGKIAARGGWFGLQVTTDGAALNVTLESSIPGDNVNISEQDKLSIIFPDYNSFTTSTSYIQMTSDPNGVFGNGYDSAQVLFSANTTSLPELRLALSGFAASGFSLSSVTGIRVHLQRSSAPSAAQTITMMAIRAVQDTWGTSWLDFDTRWDLLVVPVTLNGSAYGGTTAQLFEYVRGNGTKDDPFPQDGAYTVFFYPGGGTAPNDAADPLVNTLSLIMREIKDTGVGTGSAIFAKLTWNDTAAFFDAYREDTTGGSPGSQSQHGLHSETVSNDPLDPTLQYAFTVKLIGKSLVPSLHSVDRNREITGEIWTGATINEDEYTVRNGRVGFTGGLLNRDAYIDAFVSAPTDYAILRTGIIKTRSPVDGVRLSATFSPDANLYQSIVSDDAFLDQTKTVSGAGSYRTAKGLSTNQFVADDWTEMYLDLSIWVPNTTSAANQPTIQLNTASTSEDLRMPTLQLAQWNDLHFDLGIFRDLITGLSYSFSVLPGVAPDNPLGFFWVDKIFIGRRKVAWSARAQNGALFRRFRGLVITPTPDVHWPTGALHFNPGERGTELQIQADALTPDAWVISPIQIFPHYAELGLPVYDEGFED